MKQIIFFTLFFSFVGVASAQTLSETSKYSAVSTVESSKTRDNTVARVKRQHEMNKLIVEASTRLLERVDGPIDLMVKGKNRGFVLAENTDRNVSPDEQYRLELQVNYDARPLGGIVSIEARITPAFTGIGVARRVIRKETGAYALEILNGQTVESFVTSLLNELANNTVVVAEKAAN